MSEHNYRQESDGWWWSWAYPFTQEHGPFGTKEEMLADIGRMDEKREKRVAFLNELIETGVAFEKTEEPGREGMGWQVQRELWNTYGLCARAACTSFHDGYLHPTTGLFYCRSCTSLLQRNQEGLVMPHEIVIDDSEKRLRLEYLRRTAKSASTAKRLDVMLGATDRAPADGKATVPVRNTGGTLWGDLAKAHGARPDQRMYSNAPRNLGGTTPTVPGFRDAQPTNKKARDRKARRKAEKAARRRNR